MKIMSVVGARPNFMKIAPIIRAMKKEKSITSFLVHTGQHYDQRMSQSFFKALGIPQPDVNLGVGSGSHSEQTAKIMLSFEKVVLKERPDLILVVGDVNSTLACSLVGAKLRVAVGHVEAGLRSFDRDMPEEINRLVTDSLSDILFITSPEAEVNLLKEGIPKARIFFVGNVMIDTLMENIKKAKDSKILTQLSLKSTPFVLVTLHRPSNVDTEKSLRKIVTIFKNIQDKVKVVFPVHPRTRKNLFKFIGEARLKTMKNLVLLDPLGYLDFLNLMIHARFVMTDSGGIQEETTVLGVPCLTMRENTERPITITEGTNTLVGLDQAKILGETAKILKGQGKTGQRPKYWDGRASQRIIKKLIFLHKQNRLLRQ